MNIAPSACPLLIIARMNIAPRLIDDFQQSLGQLDVSPFVATDLVEMFSRFIAGSFCSGFIMSKGSLLLSQQSLELLSKYDSLKHWGYPLRRVFGPIDLLSVDGFLCRS